MTGRGRRPSPAEVQAALAKARHIVVDDGDLLPPPSTEEPQAPEPAAEPSATNTSAPQPVQSVPPAQPVKAPPPPPLPSIEAHYAGGDRRTLINATGFHIPPELHAKVQAAAKKLSNRDVEVQQTEVLITAFIKATTGDDGKPDPGKLAQIIAAAHQDKLVDAGVFGTRQIRVSARATKKVRLQVRPTYAEHDIMKELARGHNMKLTPLVEIVLEWYLKDVTLRRAPGAKTGLEPGTPAVSE